MPVGMRKLTFKSTFAVSINPPSTINFVEKQVKTQNQPLQTPNLTTHSFVQHMHTRDCFHAQLMRLQRRKVSR